MNSADFISLAIKLSNSQQEVELRTAVSRAYYGAFHAARELLEACGIAFPPKELLGADIHRKVRFCLANADTADALLVAGKLDVMRQQRNLADYDLRTDRFSLPSVKNVTTCVQRAIQIVDAIDRCRGETTFVEFRYRVCAYARDVLRLPVRDA